MIGTIKFKTGTVVHTPGIQDLMNQGIGMSEYLNRHITGDWGDTSPEDSVSNDHAWLHGGLRIFSVYNTPQGRIWIITEADRSRTTILLPNEY